jgi:hypothetical protein
MAGSKRRVVSNFECTRRKTERKSGIEEFPDIELHSRFIFAESIVFQCPRIAVDSDFRVL